MPTSEEPFKASPFDLQQMIAAENDPRQRVLLMLVQQGNENWAENTRAVKENAAAVKSIATDLEALFTRFEERSKADDAMKNQGKGATRVVMAIIGVVQVIGLGVWTDTRADLKEIHNAIVAGQKVDATTDVRLNAIESAVRNKGQP